MSARQLLALTIVVTATFTSACGGGMRGGVRYAGPITSSDLERGRTRFHVVCGPCHEGHLIAEAPSLEHLGWRPDQVRRQVREGTALMPPIRVERLGAGDLEALLAYLVSIGVVVEPVDEEAASGEGQESWAEYLEIEGEATTETSAPPAPVEPAPVEPAPIEPADPAAPVEAPPVEPAPVADPSAAP